MNYKIANLNEEDYKVIKKVESLVKKETGKDFIIIAWEKHE